MSETAHTKKQLEGLSATEEIQVLEDRLARLKSAQEHTSSENKETEKVLEAALGREAPSAAPAPPPPPVPPTSPVITQHLHDVKAKELKTYESDKQLRALVEIAFERGLRDAIDIARRLDDAYLLDAFHDTLTDELRKELIESGKLKEV